MTMRKATTLAAAMAASIASIARIRSTSLAFAAPLCRTVARARAVRWLKLRMTFISTPATTFRS